MTRLPLTRGASSGSDVHRDPVEPNQTAVPGLVVEVLGLRELLKTGVAVKAAVTINSNHSNAPKTVAASRSLHDFPPAEHVSVEI